MKFPPSPNNLMLDDNEPMYTSITDCRVCLGARLEELLAIDCQALTGIFPKSASESIPAGPLTLVRCLDCGLVQLAHNYELSILYRDNYGYRSGLNASMVRHLQRKVQKIQDSTVLEPGDLVVDIQSNDGIRWGRTMSLVCGVSVSIPPG
jgi:NDP-4-keto-2,6-dideoxyhexose 3-C-methyltransferase